MTDYRNTTTEQETAIREALTWCPPLRTPFVYIEVNPTGITTGSARGIQLGATALAGSLQDFQASFIHEYGHSWDAQWLTPEDHQTLMDNSGIRNLSWSGKVTGSSEFVNYNQRPDERWAGTFSYLVGTPHMGTMGVFNQYPFLDEPTVNAMLAKYRSALPFTDIDNMTDEEQAALLELYDDGIVKGTSATTFTPDGLVTRRQMVLFLDRLRRAGI